MICVGFQKWPNGEKTHTHAKLADSLREVMGHGSQTLGEALLPPGAEVPLDLLRYRLRESHEWSAPIANLETPLWVAIVNGVSRHFGIEYRLVVTDQCEVESRPGIASYSAAAPRRHSTSIPLNFSLYKEHNAEPLPADTPFDVRRGECFEAQKDGRYGSSAVTPLRGAQTLEDDARCHSRGPPE